MPTTWNALYLGVNPIIDPTEGNTTAENAGALVGSTFGGSGSALNNDVVSVATNDRGGTAGALDQNNNLSNDRITYNLGSGPVTTTFDAAAQYTVTIDYVGGQPSWTGNAVIMQDTLGNTFLVPQINAGAPQTALTAAPIWSVTVNSVTGSTYSGLAPNRQATNFLACFAHGTRILTPSGERCIENLRPGDLVVTHDAGPQPVRWIGHSATLGRGDHAPVKIAAGALGNDRCLRVSPQHRMLISNWRAELHFAAPQVLVAAKHLIGQPGITQAPCGPITYFHLLLDRHDMVLAEGSWAESFFPGDTVLQADPEVRREITALFADLVSDTCRYGPAARRVLKQAEARLLFAPEAAVAVAA